MVDLDVYDIVKINNAINESIYLESVNAIDNKEHIATTDHFRIKLDNGEVINDLGMYDNDEFELRMVWRSYMNGNYMLIWENGKELKDYKKSYNEDVRPNDVSWEEHQKNTCRKC